MGESAGARPLYVSVIGIDGSGKSSTTIRAIRRLGSSFRVLKPGRDPFFMEDGRITRCFPRASRLVESLFRRADATRRRSWIGLSRVGFVLYQGWLEPHLVRTHRPELVVSTRCMVLDPVVYSWFYFPRLDRRLTIERKLRSARRLSGLPIRDLYILLTTPTAVAMQRIHRRIQSGPPSSPVSRDHWLHLHEGEAALRGLEARFAETLAAARRISPFKLVEIDTTLSSEEEVSRQIEEEVRELARAAAGRPRESGATSGGCAQGTADSLVSPKSTAKSSHPTRTES